jgi:2TM domain
VDVAVTEVDKGGSRRVFAFHAVVGADVHQRTLDDVIDRSYSATAWLRAGRRRKAESGGYAGDGSPPFGWQSVDKQLVPVGQNRPPSVAFRELHRQGRSLRQIGDVLTAEGHSPKRGERWHPQSGSRILGALDDHLQESCGRHRRAGPHRCARRHGWWFDWIAIPWGIFLVGHAVAVFAGRRFFGPEWEQRKVDKYFARTTTYDATNCAPLDHLV